MRPAKKLAPPAVLDQAIEMVQPGDLIPHPRNPRRGDVKRICDLIKRNGFHGALLAQRSSKHVLAGNHRLAAALKLKLPAVPVIWLDVDDEHALRILLADNRASDAVGYDDAALAALLGDLPTLDGTGYDDSFLRDLLASVGTPLADLDDGPEAQVDRAAELAIEWGTERGQLWRIGEHRLLCGDATSAPDVTRLLGGAVPPLMVTDPPYGVEYDPEWRNEAASKGQLAYAAISIGQPANDDRAGWSEAWKLFPGEVAYVWHADRFASETQQLLEDSGFEIRSQIVWCKPGFAISRGHYHWQHEPCWYAVRKGATANWCGDRSQTTVWNAATLDGQSRTGHSTQKPVELFRRPLINHTKPGDSVYDPFIGSGTAFVAAEQLHRICYGIEIEPKYVAVTLQRLADMGLKPERYAT